MGLASQPFVTPPPSLPAPVYIRDRNVAIMRATVIIILADTKDPGSNPAENYNFYFKRFA